jgi:hypothetical protein
MASGAGVPTRTLREFRESDGSIDGRASALSPSVNSPCDGQPRVDGTLKSDPNDLRLAGIQLAPRWQAAHRFGRRWRHPYRRNGSPSGRITRSRWLRSRVAGRTSRPCFGATTTPITAAYWPSRANRGSGGIPAPASVPGCRGKKPTNYWQTAPKTTKPGATEVVAGLQVAPPGLEPGLF